MGAWWILAVIDMDLNRRSKLSGRMKKQLTVALYLGSLLVASTSPAADLKQAKFTQVVNEVEVISSKDSSEKFATVNDIFHMPDLVHTGVASRAELVADDKTITRVGANTIFSFDPANRTIDLQQGSLLFHSPKGKGGGVIRTGSATASVLGTTLIVTTTHNGGFKVIDLEGHVAIKFLNGLRQYLSSGQMTFILPGGRPAPIITIRLDTLTKDSRLVQGFAVPLPSLPLILQEVANQMKAIKSGEAQDTGQDVADNGDATPTTVPVVPASDTPFQTLSSSTGPAGSVAIDGSTLDPKYIVNISDSSDAFYIFEATADLPNIFINTPSIDLSPYANNTTLENGFAFYAPGISGTPDSGGGQLTINRSVTFNGLPTSSDTFLELVANTISIAPGSTVEADVGGFFLYSFSNETGMAFNGVSLIDNAPTGEIFVEADQDISMTNCTLTAPNGYMEIYSLGNLTLTNPVITTGDLDLYASGTITVSSDVQHSFHVANLNFDAGGDINLNGNDSNPVAGVVPALLSGSADLTATGNINMQNINVKYATVNMAANTINLINVAFQSGSAVSLASTSGLLAPNPNTGAASVTGDVNFISNVTYAGSPAQNAIGSGITISSLGNGITVSRAGRAP
jgi:hypothetical protein